jgi:hypothetical protein
MRTTEAAARDDLAALRRTSARMIARGAAQEHTFKHWAALDALDAHVSAAVRPALWSGIGTLTAARREEDWADRPIARAALSRPVR